MSKKRDLVAEIIEIQKRSGNSSRSYKLLKRLTNIQIAYNETDQGNLEILHYFPIAMVACAEGYFREAIKDLIDFGDPFFTNTAACFTDIKFSLKDLHPISSRTITIGSFVAHTISINNLDDINKIISIVMVSDFLFALKQTENLQYNQHPLSNPEETLSGVKKFFELRHIYCYELAMEEPIEYETINFSFNSMKEFLLASELFIHKLMVSKEDKLTEVEAAKAARKELEQISLEMEEVYQKLMVMMPSKEAERLKVAQDKWTNYLEAESLIFADGWGGATKAKFHARRAIKVKRERVLRLRQYYEQQLRNNESFELLRLREKNL